MTYGALPSREEFDAAFSGVFEFKNDKRVGTCALGPNELWVQLNIAQREWSGEAIADRPGGANEAGQWCSNVLDILGFEWI